MADTKLTPEQEAEKAAAEKAAAEKAAAEKAQWKGKPYHVLAAHHQRLLASGQVDAAAEFHRSHVATFKDK